MPELNVDTDLLTSVSKRLDLRDPNSAAVESVALATSQHYDVDGGPPPFECIVDSATGVGKTYVMGGLIEYFANTDRPVRNFLLLAPGRTIRDKSIQNFTAGTRKSLLDSMYTSLYVVDAANFDTSVTRQKMDDPTVTKLFIFTVQALTSKTGEGRATHEHTENLGGSLYEQLAELDDLVILADEHHCYRGKAFSRTIAELNPKVVVGVTATPDPKDVDLVVYRFPLATAIAQKYVKTPVLVARKDDRSDARTKLLDGVTLLKAKERMAEAHCLQNDLPPVHPVMLVIAQSITDAIEFRDILDSESFDGGAWVHKTLLVHSDLSGEVKEKALTDLEAVEDPDSPVRVIISVGMLKEGWDVKNVYVIAPLRASVSDVLTEQTLGRGMRLPFGAYTGNQMLDTVEVIAHDRYQALLAKREALNEQFIDYAILMETRRTAEGALVARKKVADEPSEVFPEERQIEDTGDESLPTNAGTQTATDHATPSDAGGPSSGTPVIQDIEQHIQVAVAEANRIPDKARMHYPRTDRDPILVPYIRRVAQSRTVSLTQVDGEDPAFYDLGRSLANEADESLTRTLLQARDGRIQGVRAADTVEALSLEIPLDASRANLLTAVMKSAGVEPRASEYKAAQRLVETVIEAMGHNAAKHLSAYPERATRRLVQLVNTRLKSNAPEIVFDDRIEVVSIDRARIARKFHESDHESTFNRGTAYNNWSKNLYEYAWFDSSTEYKAAQAIDEGDNVVVWARLHRDDIPITWTLDGREYNPDFVVIEETDNRRVCWLVETKMNTQLTSAEVIGKRKAAKTWANMATDSDQIDGQWRYLLLSEDDVDDAGRNWEQMKAFGK